MTKPAVSWLIKYETVCKIYVLYYAGGGGGGDDDYNDVISHNPFLK